MKKSLVERLFFCTELYDTMILDAQFIPHLLRGTLLLCKFLLNQKINHPN